MTGSSCACSGRADAERPPFSNSSPDSNCPPEGRSQFKAGRSISLEQIVVSCFKATIRYITGCEQLTTSALDCAFRGSHVETRGRLPSAICRSWASKDKATNILVSYRVG